MSTRGDYHHCLWIPLSFSNGTESNILGWTFADSCKSCYTWCNKSHVPSLKFTSFLHKVHVNIFSHLRWNSRDRETTFCRDRETTLSVRNETLSWLNNPSKSQSPNIFLYAFEQCNNKNNTFVNIFNSHLYMLLYETITSTRTTAKVNLKVCSSQKGHCRGSESHHSNQNAWWCDFFFTEVLKSFSSYENK